MKKIIKISLAAAFILLLVLLVSCKEETSSQNIWENAIYTEDTELGEGALTLKTEVVADGKTVTFTVHTDAKTVGAALIEHGLIAGDEGDYGLYIKDVNGMKADYDIDQTYWAFYVNGEYAMSGADMTEIDESAVYRFERTK